MGGSVTANKMAVVHKNSGHQVIGNAVSVCLTPAAPSPLPIPYPLMGTVGEGTGDTTLRTKANGQAIVTVGSVISKCHGNEPGTLKEVVSLNTGGPSFLLMGAPTVITELGMTGITGSPCMMNKQGIAMSAGGGGGGGGGAGAAGSASGAGAPAPSGPNPNGPGGGGPGGHATGAGGSGGGGGGGGAGASGDGEGKPGPGESSNAADGHTCQNGHPVNVVTGAVVDRAVDLELPGLIPFKFERFYSSVRHTDKNATLGPGWAHNLEQFLRLGEGTILLREGEGRWIGFPEVPVGYEWLHRRERLLLSHPGEYEYHVTSLDTHQTQVFSVFVGDEVRLTSIVDSSGNRLDFAYEAGRLAQVVDTAGRVVRLDWRGGKVVGIRVEGGPSVRYHYAESGYLEAVENALGVRETFEYDDRGRMVATTTKGGERFIYEYDAEGRCVLTHGADNAWYTALSYDPVLGETRVTGVEPRVYRWNALGLAERESTADGTLLEAVAYDADGKLVAKTDGSGQGHRYHYDDRGNLIEVINANGRSRHFAYQRDRVVRFVDYDGLSTSYDYDERGLLREVLQPTGARYTLEHDERGRLSRVLGPRGEVAAYEYDAKNNLVSESDAKRAVTKYVYDALGRPLQRTDPLGRKTRVTYDILGRRTRIDLPDGTARTFTYDSAGRLNSSTNGAGETTTLRYRGIAALKEVELPDGRLFKLTHNENEKLLQVENPQGETHGYERDQAGRVVLEKTFDQRTLTYRYSSGGKVSEVLYPDGSGRKFEYSFTGQVTREYGKGTELEFLRDTMGRIVDAKLQAHGETIQTVFERDPFGRVIAEVQQGRRIEYERDIEGRVTKRVLPNGATTEYETDENGLLRSVTQNGQRIDLTRDAAGREIARQTQSGLALTSGYDELDRLTRRSVETPGDAPPPSYGGTFGSGPAPAPSARFITDRRYDYDKAGRVKRIESDRWGTTEYFYDPAGRLTEARSRELMEVFTHDPASSIAAWVTQESDGTLPAIQVHSKAPKTEQGEYGPGGRLLKKGTTSFEYDAKGRRTAKIKLTDDGTEARTTYEWDGRDRLRSLKKPDGTTLTYTYDAFGRRVGKTVTRPGARPEQTAFVWDGEVLALELSAERGARTFVHEPGTFEPFLQEERGQIYLTVNDHLGMPKELISAQGEVTWSAAHSAYGRVIKTEGDGSGVESPFRLLGQVADDEAELTWTRFRCFDSEVGAWISTDPLEMAGGLNLYGFDGAPTGVVDPLGLEGTSGGSECTALVPYYPPNNGFSGTPDDIVLPPGSVIDRFGKPDGRFVSPAGTPMPMRALPYDADLTQYHQYEVLRPLPVKSGTIAPAFGELGGGQQHVLERPASDLVKDGYLRKIPNPVRP